MSAPFSPDAPPVGPARGDAPSRAQGSRDPRRQFINRFTPRASRRAQIAAAALLWSVVGFALLIAGSAWTATAPPLAAAALLGMAAAAGLAKGHFLLTRAADRLARRIDLRGDGRCLGGFLSWKTWGVVLLMAGLGRALRASPVAVPIRGAVYVAVGTGLLVGSRLLWARAFRGERPEARG